jgi:hypothetical protein
MSEERTQGGVRLNVPWSHHQDVGICRIPPANPPERRCDVRSSHLGAKDASPYQESLSHQVTLVFKYRLFWGKEFPDLIKKRLIDAWRLRPVLAG